MLFIAITVALAVLAVGLSFPYLAVNDPVGARVAVVEGWIPEQFLPQVREVLDRNGYDRVYITGTPRRFSYTLRIGDTIHVQLIEAGMGTLTVNACGSNGAGFRILDATGTLFEDSVTGTCIDHSTRLGSAIDHLSITPTFNGLAQPDWELLYTSTITLDGRDLHTLARSVEIRGADGRTRPGTPSFAELAAAGLIDAGLDAERIIPLRALRAGRSRTWANARLFAARAARDGLTAVDVISFGIHARRSRVTYQSACGPGMRVGIISMPDPDLQRGRWWRTPVGWIKVMKELAGVPASYLVDPVKWNNGTALSFRHVFHRTTERH